MVAGITLEKPTTNFGFGLSWLSSPLVFTIGFLGFLYIDLRVGYF